MEQKELITAEETWSVLQFASALSGVTNGVYTPWALQQNLANLNTRNGILPDLEQVQKALISVRENSDAIITYTQSLNNVDMLFRKALEYYSNMLSFDLSISCSNMDKPKNYRSKEYKEDLNRVYKFLDKFNYKEEFRKVVKNLLRNETFYVCFRDDAINGYALQMLPQNYCMTTGYWEMGLLFDFDFSYFLNPTVDINLYPDSFKTKFNNVMNGKGVNNYIPSNQLNDRSGTYTLYSQLSPTIDKAWGFKFEMSNFVDSPYLSPLLQDIILNMQTRLLQRDKDMASAYAMLMGEMKMLENQKSGQEANAFAVTPKVLGHMLHLIQSSLNKNIKANAFPVENLKMFQYKDNDPNLLEQRLNACSGLGASANNMIYSSGKSSQSEIQNQILTDYNMMKKLYSQFESFLNYYINKKTRKYKFRFTLDGSNYLFERKERFDLLQKAVDRGILLNESYFASVLGIKPQDFSRALDEGHYSDFSEKLTPMLSIHTQTGKEGGRPIKDSGLKDSGAVSRDYS